MLSLSHFYAKKGRDFNEPFCCQDPTVMMNTCSLIKNKEASKYYGDSYNCCLIMKIWRKILNKFYAKLLFIPANALLSKITYTSISQYSYLIISYILFDIENKFPTSCDFYIVRKCHGENRYCVLKWRCCKRCDWHTFRIQCTANETHVMRTKPQVKKNVSCHSLSQKCYDIQPQSITRTYIANDIRNLKKNTQSCLNFVSS